MAKSPDSPLHPLLTVSASFAKYGAVGLDTGMRRVGNTNTARLEGRRPRLDVGLDGPMVRVRCDDGFLTRSGYTEEWSYCPQVARKGREGAGSAFYVKRSAELRAFSGEVVISG